PADEIGHDAQCGAKTVVAPFVHIAAMQTKKALQYAGSMMQAARAGPTVGAAVDGFVAVLGLDPAQLVGNQCQRFVPTDRHEGVAAASLPIALMQITGANVGLVNPQRASDQ